MTIFELSSILKKLKRFRTFEWYFRKQLTIEAIRAKYEEIPAKFRDCHLILGIYRNWLLIILLYIVRYV